MISTTPKNLIDILNNVCSERKITFAAASESLQKAFLKAFEKAYPEECFEVVIDENNKKIILNKLITVIDDNADDEVNDYSQITLKDAKKVNKDAAVGDVIREELKFDSLSTNVKAHVMSLFSANIKVETNMLIYNQ
jgi:hypothetical protein